MAASGKEIRAGGAFVELFTKDNLLYKGLNKASSYLKSWGQTMAKAGAIPLSIGSGVLAPMIKLLGDAASRGNDVQTLATRFGATVEQVSGLAYAAERAGVGMEGFGEILAGISSKVSHAADMNDVLDDTLVSLGRGRQLLDTPIVEVFEEIADTIARTTKEADKLRVADAFGMRALLPYLTKGREGLEQLVAEGEKAGAVITPEQAKQSQEIVRAYTKGMQDLKYAVMEVGNQLIPTGAELASLSGHAIEGIHATRDWIKESGGQVRMIAKLAAGAVAAGAAIIGLGGTMTTAASVITAGVSVTTAGFAALLSPVGLVTAAVVGLGVVWATNSEEGKAWADQTASGFQSVKNTAIGAWADISAALSSGDLEGAVKLAGTGMQLVWAQTILELTRSWNGFKDTFVDGWSDAVDGMTMIMIGFAAEYEAITTGSMERGRKKAQELFDHLQEMMGEEERARKKARADDEAAAKKGAEDAAVANENARNDARLAQQLKEDERARQALLGKGIGAQVRAALGPGGVAPAIPTFAQIGAISRGIFSGPAQQQLGYGDATAKRQLDAAISTAANTAVLPKMAANLNGLANGLQFK